MKGWIWYLVIGLVLLYSTSLFNGCTTLSYDYQVPEKTRYYDSSGKYVGHSIKNKYGERYYDKNGRFIMKSR